MSVIVRLGLGHAGSLRLCLLAGRRWCAEKRKGRGSFMAEVVGLAALLIAPIPTVPDFRRGAWQTQAQGRRPLPFWSLSPVP